MKICSSIVEIFYTYWQYAMYRFHLIERQYRKVLNSMTHSKNNFNYFVEKYIFTVKILNIATFLRRVLEFEVEGRKGG